MIFYYDNVLPGDHISLLINEVHRDVSQTPSKSTNDFLHYALMNYIVHNVFIVIIIIILYIIFIIIIYII